MNIFPSGGHGYGFTTPDLGNDGLGTHRELFFRCVSHFLKEIGHAAHSMTEIEK